MTRIDKYLEKYLDGSITEKETEEFRQLLASDPRLEQELGETLELRSVIHDDLLEIELPAWLSSRVGTLVGGRFAALPIQPDQFVEEEEEEKRRGVILPWFVSGRMAGSMAVATIALLMVALAPTIDFDSGNQLNVWSPVIAESGTGSDGFAPPGIPPVSGEEPIADVADHLQSAQSGPAFMQNRGSIRKEEGRDREGDMMGEGESGPPDIGIEDAFAVNRAVEIGIEGREDPVEQLDLSQPNEGIGISTDRLIAENSINDLQWLLSAPNALDYYIQDNRGSDRQDLELPISRSSRSVVPSVDDVFGELSADPRGVTLSWGGRVESPDLADTRVSVEENGERYQRVMFGGTLASGVTSRTTGLTLEGSAYLALGLGQNSRIGLEGGSATFRNRRDVAVEILTPASSGMFTARSVVNNDDDEKGVIQIRAAGQTSSGGEGGGDLNPGGKSGNGVGDHLNPHEPSVSHGDPLPTRGRVEGYNVSYGMESNEFNESMVYGLVFYDQTVTSLTERLKLNGRIGVGGADGGMVLSARAYASIASNENVAWTLGVGGSMLHDFAQEIDFNATYGLNAGVEFGF